MIRIVIADDHHLVRQGIVRLLESADDLDVVGEAENGQEALALARSLHPDVIVLDLTMPKFDGFDALTEISQMSNRPQVVILSMHAEPTMIRQALQAGALGYVVKQSVADELLAAVRAASSGSMFLSAGVANIIASDVLVERSQNPLDLLSPRELEVVQCIVEGCSTREIAQNLRTSVKTVEKQRRDAMRKLEVDNTASLVRVSLELGLDIKQSSQSQNP